MDIKALNTAALPIELRVIAMGDSSKICTSFSLTAQFSCPSIFRTTRDPESKKSFVFQLVSLSVWENFPNIPVCPIRSLIFLTVP